MEQRINKEPRIIKTEQQYAEYLAEIDQLMEADPELDSRDGARLELFAKLVEDYEKSKFAFSKPDPVDAIVFRMEEQGLLQKDIAELLGGKNRASEILGRKRPLTLKMIRELHEGLGIPLELLIQEPKQVVESDFEIDGSTVPMNELIKRGWIDAKMAVSELLRRFEAPQGSPIRLRSTQTFGSNNRTNFTSLWLWLSRIRELADASPEISKRYSRNQLSEEFIRYVSRLSYMSNGPRLAKECLEENGISLIIEPHLPKTHLDGVAMLGRNGTPVIGLTVRLDRIDNFWFTLIHELVHAWKHLDKDERRTIADENIEKHSADDEIEVEANGFAREILIPTGVFRRSDVYLAPTSENILELAHKLHVHPATVAGRVRYETKNYSKFSNMIGNRQVRSSFPEVRW